MESLAVVNQAGTVLHTESCFPSPGGPFNITVVPLGVPVDHDDYVRMRMFIRAVLFTDDDNGRVYPVFGRCGCLASSFSPESTGFRQDVVSLEIPDKILGKQCDVPG